MPEKKALDKEKEAWDEYMEAIEASGSPEEKKKGGKKNSGFWGKMKFWGKKEPQAQAAPAEKPYIEMQPAEIKTGSWKPAEEKAVGIDGIRVAPWKRHAEKMRAAGAGGKPLGTAEPLHTQIEKLEKIVSEVKKPAKKWAFEGTTQPWLAAKEENSAAAKWAFIAPKPEPEKPAGKDFFDEKTLGPPMRPEIAAETQKPQTSPRQNPAEPKTLFIPKKVAEMPKMAPIEKPDIPEEFSFRKLPERLELPAPKAAGARQEGRAQEKEPQKTAMPIAAKAVPAKAPGAEKKVIAAVPAVAAKQGKAIAIKASGKTAKILSPAARKAAARAGKKLLLAEKKQRIAAAKAEKKRALAEKKRLLAGAKAAGKEKKLALKKEAAEKRAAKKTVTIRVAPELVPEIKRVIKMVRIAKKTRGWYGEKLRHKKVAMSSWLDKKRERVFHLREKARKKKLRPHEAKTLKRLVAEKDDAEERLAALEERMRALRNVGREINNEEMQITRKVKDAGITISKKEMSAVESESTRMRSEEDIVAAIEAVRSVAEDMAAFIARMPPPHIRPEDAMGIDDRIATTKKMMRELELAFYKRKIGFGQFRGKLFEYQSKLGELLLKKRYIDEKKNQQAAEQPQEAAAAGAPAGLPKAIGGTGAESAAQQQFGLNFRIARTLEKISSLPKGGAYPAPQPVIKDEMLEKALEQMADRISSMHAYAPQPQRGISERAIERIIEKTAQPGEAPAGQAGGGAAQPYREWPAAQPQQAAPYQPRQAPVERIIERIASHEQAQPYGEQPMAAPMPRMARLPPSKGKGKGKWAKAAAYAPRGAQQMGTPIQPVGWVAVPMGAAPEGAFAGTAPAGWQAPAGPPRGMAWQSAAAAQATGGAQEPQAAVPPRGRAKPVAAPGAGGWEGAGETRAIEKPRLASRIERAIEEKAGGRISKDQIDRIESDLAQLLRRHKIPDESMEQRIMSLNSDRLVEDFHKLITLLEVQQASKIEEQIKPAPDFEDMTITAQKKEKVPTMEKEIIKARIETDFDRILNIVKFKGTAGLDEVAKELGMDKARVQEYSNILEENRLIELIYPPIGPMKLAYPGYLRWKETQRKKADEEKKKKQEKQPK